MPRVSAYVLFVCVAAVVSVVLVAVWGQDITREMLIAAGVFAFLAVFTQAFTFGLASSAAGAVSFFPFLAAAVLAPAWSTIVAIALSVGVSEMIVRRPLLKAVFNVAQHCLAIALGLVAYLLLGGQSLLHDPQPHLIPYIALFFVFLFLNTAAVSGAVAVSQQRPFRTVWHENTKGMITYDVLSLPFVYLFARVYLYAGPAGPVLLSIPLLGVRELYRTNSQLQKVNHELLRLMVAAIEARDPYTSGHSQRVSHFSRTIARAIGLSAKEVERIGIAALLHDVGKIHEVYAPLLRKPDRLTIEERMVMETHPVKSAELVANVTHLRDLVSPIRHHHENWDGSGYPDGLVGESIPLASRIIMIADTIDAMTSDRPYRKALSGDQVLAEIRRLRGRQFDPVLCDQVLASPHAAKLFAQPATPSLPDGVRALSLVPRLAHPARGAASAASG